MSSFNIGPFIQALPAIIGLAQAFGVKPSSGTAITTIAADAAALAQGGQPSAASAAEFAQLLQDMKAQGILSGSAMDQALKVVAVVKNYTSGQVAVLDSNFTALGKPGHVFAIADDSTNEAALAFRQAVGLSGPAQGQG